MSVDRSDKRCCSHRSNTVRPLFTDSKIRASIDRNAVENASIVSITTLSAVLIEATATVILIPITIALLTAVIVKTTGSKIRLFSALISFFIATGVSLWVFTVSRD